MKIKSLILSLALIFTLSGCDDAEIVTVNVSNDDTSQSINNKIIGKSALVEIGNYLWYDSVTGIVYWWNGYLDDFNRAATTPSLYYSPNGLPYRYLPETNTLDEIRGCYTNRTDFEVMDENI